jgi:hypothetical protein
VYVPFLPFFAFFALFLYTGMTCFQVYVPFLGIKLYTEVINVYGVEIHRCTFLIKMCIKTF